jgi:hypothetical protein
MGEIAELLAAAVRRKSVKEGVHQLRGRFLEMRYC